MFERFTEKAIKTVTKAQEEARNLNHKEVKPEHLLLGILSLETAISAKFLRSAGLKQSDLRKAISENLSSLSVAQLPEVIPFSNEIKKILTLAWDKARLLGANYISPEYLFLSLIEDKNSSAVKIIKEFEIDLVRIETTIKKLAERRDKRVIHPEGISKHYKSCSKYCSIPLNTKDGDLSDVFKVALAKLSETNYEALGTEQMVQAILENKDSEIINILDEEGINAEKFNEKLSHIPSRASEYINHEHLFTPKSLMILNLASEMAKELGSATITADHILLAILKEKSGLAYQVLNDFGINTDTLYSRLLKPIEKQRPTALTILNIAKEEARRLGHNAVGTELVLLGIMGESAGIGARVLNELGVTIKDARKEVEKIIGYGNDYKDKEINYTRRAKKLLETAWSNAKKYNCQRIESEHLLLGITQEKECIGMKVLERLGVDSIEVKQGIIKEIKIIKDETSSE